jgi:hypothetical protein
MKKTLIITVLGASLSTLSSYGQGLILLDNYNTGGPNVTFGVGSGGTVGAGLTAGWTMGLYYAVGNISGSIGADASGTAIPSDLGALVLGSGAGSTAAFSTSTFGTDGQALSGATFTVPGTLSAGGDTITVMLIAYNGATYADSTVRGHSSAFTMPTSAATSNSPNPVGSYMSAFSVYSVTPVPEPSTLALAGLGGFGMLMALRRKKA